MERMICVKVSTRTIITPSRMYLNIKLENIMRREDRKKDNTRDVIFSPTLHLLPKTIRVLHTCIIPINNMFVSDSCLFLIV